MKKKGKKNSKQGMNLQEERLCFCKKPSQRPTLGQTVIWDDDFIDVNIFRHVFEV